MPVADLATAIPGGAGVFMGFGDVSISDTDVAFLGYGANGQQGIYDMTGSALVRVVGLNDILDGRAITGLQFLRTGLFEDPIAFQADLRRRLARHLHHGCRPGARAASPCSAPPLWLLVQPA